MPRLKALLLSILSLSCLLAAAPSSPAYAVNAFEETCKSAAAKDSPVCKTSGQDPITGRNGILYRVSRIFATLTGIAAVVLIIIGGLRLVFAGGDSNNVTSARHMIVGATIGLVIVALAETIVLVVINMINRE